MSVAADLLASMRRTLAFAPRHECAHQWGVDCSTCSLREQIEVNLSAAEAELEKVRLGIYRPDPSERAE